MTPARSGRWQPQASNRDFRFACSRWPLYTPEGRPAHETLVRHSIVPLQRPSAQPVVRRWCTNRNGHATVPTTGASSTDGVGRWAAHVGHRIQQSARELRFDRSPTECPGSKTIADDRLTPEECVLDSRLLMVA